MTWSIQLTTWALPALLGVLVTLREAGYLWPRRAERAAGSLLTLLGVSGTWAMLHLLVVVNPDLDVKLAFTGAAYTVGAAAPVVWVWFSLTLAGRRDLLRRWPAVLLYAVSLGTVLLAILLTRHGLLVEQSTLVDRGDILGLRVETGPWHRVHAGVRVIAVVTGTAILLRALLRRSDAGPRIVLLPIAAAVALAPTFLHLGGGAPAAWTDLTPAGFAVGSALLAWGVLRHRLLHLGPVARTLVMVELRDPIVVLDAKGRIVDVNRAAERILGLRPYGDVPVALGTLWAASWRDPDATSRITLEVEEGESVREDSQDDRSRGEKRRDDEARRAWAVDGVADHAGGESAGEEEASAELERTEGIRDATTGSGAGDGPGDRGVVDDGTGGKTGEGPDAGEGEGPDAGEGEGRDAGEREGRDAGAIRERTFEVTITPLGARGVPGHTAIVFRDITDRDRVERHLIRTTEELTEANRELERLAHTDPLTDLANRRHFMDGLAREVERSLRYERPLSLVLLDLDHFKKVNDTYGHAAGDAVLRSAAAALRSVSRDVDLPARIGGEEFAILLPETDRRGARRVAERIREKIEASLHRTPEGDGFRVTTSVGVASVGAGVRNGDALLRAADDALYRAKRAGRNRVMVSG